MSHLTKDAPVGLRILNNMHNDPALAADLVRELRSVTFLLSSAIFALQMDRGATDKINAAVASARAVIVRAEAA